MISLLLLLLLLVCCGKQPAADVTDPSAQPTGDSPVASPDAPAPTGIWSLGERYPITYGTFAHVYHYVKGESPFFLTESRSTKSSLKPKNTKESTEVDGVIYAQCESGQQTEAGERYTYFECYTGERHLKLASDERLPDLASVLSLSDAVALMRSPLDPPDGVTFTSEEWAAYYRTDACNLEIYVYPNDGGKHYAAPDEHYEELTEGGDTYLCSDYELAVLYTDGTNTVWIRQANRSGSEHTLYTTLDECKAILTLLDN